jgi:hypothetical protein
MAYVLSKTIRRGEREYTYYQLVEGYREPETGAYSWSSTTPTRKPSSRVWRGGDSAQE